jgi:hypothetical protein
MKKLAALIALATSRALCNPPPPAQAPEEKVNVPGEAASASAHGDPDIGENGQAPPPPPPPAEAFPAVRATLGGGAWEIKGAATIGPVGGDGTVAITLGNYNVECGAHAPAAGDLTLTFTIPWEKGAKVDIAALKAKAILAAGYDEKKKTLEPLKSWKPTGTIEVLAAPTKGKSSGRIRINLEAKLDAVRAEIPVRFCFPS